MVYYSARIKNNFSEVLKMKTRQGYTYFIEDGKYTIDGYDFFDTLEALEEDLDWQILWAEGKAFKSADGKWQLTEEARLAEEARNKAHYFNIMDSLLSGRKWANDSLYDQANSILAEIAKCMVADGRLTWKQIHEVTISFLPAELRQ